MRRSLLLLTTMALGVLMVSSVALALNRISCQPDAFLCEGTTGDDSMSGTAGYDNMHGGLGNDKLNGYGGGDDLTGDE
jgi:Ca2+-binding RTX toxin-like protein